MEYLLKSSAIVIIFYACYKLLLERETFFESNRWFLLGGLIMSILIPFIVIPIYIEYTPTTQSFIISETGELASSTAQNTFDYMELVSLIYITGVLFFTSKLLVEFSSLFVLFKTNKRLKINGFTHIETSHKASPFSFFKCIVYNKDQFSKVELDHVINHEKVHAKQYHSIDVILVQLASVVLWFNPFIWLYKKELQQNLEFIADQKAQTISECEKSYQTLLLKASVPNYQLAFTNNFYNSLIKKRIVMLHKSKSNQLNVWKYALILPVLAFFLMSANTKKVYVEKVIPMEEVTSYASPSIDLISKLPTDQAEIDKPEPKETFSANSEKTALSNSNNQPKNAVAKFANISAMITKDLSDAELDAIKKEFKDEGVTVKIKGVKRNGKNEITAIKIDVDSKDSNANYHTESDDPIRPIRINVDDKSGKISIGNAGHKVHYADESYKVVSKDGKHKIHKAGKGSKVFVFSDDHDDDEDHEEEIIIEGEGKAHTIHKGKGNVHFISEDGNVIKVKDKSVVIRKVDGDDEDTKVIRLEKVDKAKKVWTNKKDDVEVYEFDSKGENKFFISNTDGKEPLYILNGKEITKKEMDEVNPDNIDKVEVFKGDKATEKYGDKGKNGVVLITTKEK
ncbi:beta-lactamase regulating signal transducer with metallopeptidase domain [Flavobacteriaceae bacterium MAR_2010_105]|nr:beta-lactamase regulating signal transducer with metallopeptidase domain [Flavobacteriaceae bacterium MAR_2010_105]